MHQQLVVQEVEPEASDFKTFTLACLPGQKITYKAGQYLTLLHPDFPEEVRRSYSFVSAPGLGENLKIGVKRIPNGILSRYLIDSLKPGDKLLTIGAGGFFTLPRHPEQFEQVFFLAAGSGITPVLSLLKTVLYQFPRLKAVLIYSSRSPETAYYKTELESLQKNFPETLVVEYIYSNAANLARAHLHRELLVYFIQQFAVTTPAKTLAFTCGPKEYMRMCQYGFHMAGIPKENTRKEIFNVEKAIPLVEPPDKEQHLVTIQNRPAPLTFPVQFPVSVLQEAKKRGVNLPYSCEAGRCGNCVAKCVEGKVWMAYNEVLTQKELNQGLFLTCVGYPVGGNITIEV